MPLRELRLSPCLDIVAKRRSLWADARFAPQSPPRGSPGAHRGGSKVEARLHPAGPPEQPGGAAVPVAADQLFRQCPAPLAAPLELLPLVCRIAACLFLLDLRRRFILDRKRAGWSGPFRVTSLWLFLPVSRDTDLNLLWLGLLSLGHMHAQHTSVLRSRAYNMSV